MQGSTDVTNGSGGAPASERDLPRSRVGVLLPPLTARGGFPGAAITACEALVDEHGPGLVDVRLGHTGPPDPSWDAVLCHGGQWVSWVREHRPTDSHQVVITDRVPFEGADDPLRRASMVDWHWDQAAYLAGVLAAHLVQGTSGPRRVGLLAGPPVPTQRRVAAAFTEGAAATATHAGEVLVAHASAFDDISGGQDLADLLVRRGGCRVLAHAADSAGEAGTTLVRTDDVATLGFLEPVGLHAATIDSDVEGVVADLITALVRGEPLPPVIDAGLASGRLDLVVADPALQRVLTSFRPAAILL